MKITYQSISTILATALILGGISVAGAQEPDESTEQRSPEREAVEQLIEGIQDETPSYDEWEVIFPPRTRLVDMEREDGALTLIFNENLTDRTISSDDKEKMLSSLRDALGDQLEQSDELTIKVRIGRGEDAQDWPLDEFLTTPEIIRERQQAREEGPASLDHPLVERVDYAGPTPERGLLGSNLFISASHGWTWHKENRWQYQRARLFTTVEDLYPMSYINPFLIPMLENAGATVFSARERDFQTYEVIVDNDKVSSRSDFRTRGEWSTGDAKGWHGPRPAALAEDEEPFTLGTTIRAEVNENGKSEAVYVPYVQRRGRYAVYASWAASPWNSPAVPITVNHLGGSTTFHVNQQVAGNTWVFLGFFEFDQGAAAETGSVVISTEGAALREPSEREREQSEEEGEEATPSTFVSADAVRFGGGMGNIAPEDMVSYKPRYAESSRYFAQYSGAPAEEVYLSDVSPGHFGVDYNRDVTARPEWANYINGSPNGPNDHRNMRGLGVPLDLMFSWHTDAGHEEDGLVGTLLIHRIPDQEGDLKFPDGRSRVLNRDLSAIVQDEIVRMARKHYTSEWPRRGLWNRSYSEVRRPNVPSALVELLSHQNFNDMKYGNDPRFKRDIARAVYKGLLRFVAYSKGYEPVIQPLQPTHLVATSQGGGTVELQWKPQEDPIEATATPDGYVVYMGNDGKAFDNGMYVEDTKTIVEDLESDTNYFFRVTAVNAGGESLPSRVVGVRWSEEAKPVLIVDGFDRISAPAIVHEDGVRGFDRQQDPGVGYENYYGLAGDQYDFDPDSDWVNDLESPGRGGSQNLFENRLVRGNTFDHIVYHGETLAALGIPFNSCTSDAFAEGMIEDQPWMIDWIAGLQRSTPPPKGLEGEGTPDKMDTEFETLPREARERLINYVKSGGKFVISGSYIVHDLLEGPLTSQGSRDFARTLLGITDYEEDGTSINAVVPDEDMEGLMPFRFGRDLEAPVNMTPSVYSVHSSEAYTGGVNTRPLVNYGDSGWTAGIAGDGVVLLGFPLETVLPMEGRHGLMKTAIKQLHPDWTEPEEAEEEEEKE